MFRRLVQRFAAARTEFQPLKEIPVEQLRHVAGGSPKGKWETDSPKGKWETDSPKGKWETDSPKGKW
jgi:hypothetical protein